LDWHRGYDEDPSMARRLRVVQDRIVEALDGRPRGSVRVISAGAGDDRDLLGALNDHPRAQDVLARPINEKEGPPFTGNEGWSEREADVRTETDS
jgi:hypothetical protein